MLIPSVPKFRRGRNRKVTIGPPPPPAGTIGVTDWFADGSPSTAIYFDADVTVNPSGSAIPQFEVDAGSGFIGAINVTQDSAWSLIVDFAAAVPVGAAWRIVSAPDNIDESAEIIVPQSGVTVP